MSRTNSASTNPVSQPLKCIDVLAEGHSNLVLLVENPKTKKQLVAKIVNDDNEALIDNLKLEARNMAHHDHHGIVKCLGFVENLLIVNDEGQEMMAPGILMDYAPNGDMFELLSNFTQFPSFIARSFAKQMADVVAYLHAKGIAHLDIKLENFLLDEKFIPKIADFGFARKTTSETLQKCDVGTPDYWTPEQNEKKDFNGFKADVFALGLMLFIMVTGRMPFEKATKEDEYYSKLYSGNVEGFWDKHEEEMGFSSSNKFFKEDFKSLISGMLHPDLAKRMTIHEVLNHPWLKISPEMVEKCGGIVAEFLKKKCRIN